MLTVGVVPVAGQLDLKALAAAAGGKKARMAERRRRPSGPPGTSPAGSRRWGTANACPSWWTARPTGFETIFCSGGRRGLEIELAPADAGPARRRDAWPRSPHPVRAIPADLRKSPRVGQDRAHAVCGVRSDGLPRRAARARAARRRVTRCGRWRGTPASSTTCPGGTGSRSSAATSPTRRASRRRSTGRRSSTTSSTRCTSATSSTSTGRRRGPSAKAAAARRGGSSTSAGSRRTPASCPRTCAPARRSARSCSASGVPDRRPQRGDHHRLRVGQLRDAALPHRAAPRHGHAPLGAQPDPADRRPRRAALPHPRRATVDRRGQPRLRHRRPGRADLPGDDAPLRGRRRAPPPGRRAGAGAHAVAVRAVGQPGHARAAQHRGPADRVARARGRRPRPRRRRATSPTRRPGRRTYEHAIELALARIRDADVPTRWSDASAPSDPLPTDPDWSGGSDLHRRPRAAHRRRPGQALGRSSSPSAASTAGTPSRSPGRCAAGSTGSPAAPGCAAAGATRAGCTPARRSTGGASSGWSGRTCCGCARRCGCPAAPGWSCPRPRARTAARPTGSARSSSRTGWPATCTGSRSPRSTTSSSAAWPATSRVPPSTRRSST